MDLRIGNFRSNQIKNRIEELNDDDDDDDDDDESVAIIQIQIGSRIKLGCSHCTRMH